MQETETGLAQQVEKIHNFLEGRVVSSLEDTVERVALFNPEMTFNELWEQVSESLVMLTKGNITDTLDTISKKKVTEKSVAELLIGKYIGELAELLQGSMFADAAQKLSATERAVILKLVAERIQVNSQYKTDLEDLFNTKRK